MILPVSLSTQTTDSLRPSSVALVSQICLPRTTGLDHALPGMGVFQATLSSSLHSVGKPFESEIP
ncbi:hypothetical protein D3C83_323960 [compost metagenome]